MSKPYAVRLAGQTNHIPLVDDYGRLVLTLADAKTIALAAYGSEVCEVRGPSGDGAYRNNKGRWVDVPAEKE